jgi:urease accessory protein
MYRAFQKIFPVLALALIPALALAHPGHAEAPGFAAGFLHPLTGIDHLAALLAVGVLSAQTTRRAWALPLSFAVLMLAGALFASTGARLPSVEAMIAVSLLVIGLLIAARAPLPIHAGAALVGFFALFHGAAHGAEFALAGNPAAALAGMTLSTLLIPLAGMRIGALLLRVSPRWTRALGGVVSLFGAVLLAGMAGVA